MIDPDFKLSGNVSLSAQHFNFIANRDEQEKHFVLRLSLDKLSAPVSSLVDFIHLRQRISSVPVTSWQQKQVVFSKKAEAIVRTDWEPD